MTKSVKEIEHVMNVGNQNRAVGYVHFNSFILNKSSRILKFISAIKMIKPDHLILSHDIAVHFIT